jgi:HEAT repeat protein
MDIEQIKNALNDADPQQRMKGIRELRNYEPMIATPLLLNHVQDQEFLVRSFVAMGLGRKQSDAAFAALLTMMQQDQDPNVRSEAANSLSFYGEAAVPHLRAMYESDDHWLVRRSIIAAIVDLKSPQELLEICAIGLAGEDEPVMESCISALGLFGKSELLLPLADDPAWRIRLQVARSLGRYDHPEAIATLSKLKGDSDHRVVGAVLESLM